MSDASRSNLLVCGALISPVRHLLPCYLYRDGQYLSDGVLHSLHYLSFDIWIVWKPDFTTSLVHWLEFNQAIALSIPCCMVWIATYISANLKSGPENGVITKVMVIIWGWTEIMVVLNLNLPSVDHMWSSMCISSDTFITKRIIPNLALWNSISPKQEIRCCKMVQIYVRFCSIIEIDYGTMIGDKSTGVLLRNWHTHCLLWSTYNTPICNPCYNRRREFAQDVHILSYPVRVER